jgi:hypothetical protein
MYSAVEDEDDENVDFTKIVFSRDCGGSKKKEEEA